MTSCPLTPTPRSPRFRLAEEAVEELALLVLVAHRDPQDLRVIQALLDLRATPVNVDLPDQKALEVFRVPLGLLVAELGEHPFLALKDLGVLLALPDPREIRGFKALPDLRVTTDFLAQPEQTVNLDLRVRMARPVLLALLVHRVLQDLLESVALRVRMR